MIHLIYGGSSAQRTIGCPGWIEATEDLPKSPAGPAASLGSMHHEVQEMARREGKEPADYLGHIYKENGVDYELTEDELDTSLIAFAATDKVLDEFEIDEFEIEPFVEFDPGLIGGSIDLLGLSISRTTLMILDYKFGSVKVNVTESAQHFLYAMSARRDPKTADMFKNVLDLVFVIIQPKVKGGVSTWKCDIKELDAFEKKFLAAVESDELHAGAHCKWCPAAPYCKTKRADVVGAKALGARVKKELQEGANILEEVEAWVNDMKSELYTQLTRGVSIKGWKIVDKRATRKWTDETVIREALTNTCIKESVFTKTTLLTAPQMVTAFKRNKIDFDLDDFITVKSSGTTLAPEHDDRDAVKVGDIPDNLKKLAGNENSKSKTPKKGKK